MAKQAFILYAKIGDITFTEKAVRDALRGHRGNLSRFRQHGVMINITPPYDEKVGRKVPALWRFTKEFVEYVNTPDGQEELEWATRHY